MKRGDVWTAATGSGFGGKPRPVVVLQGDTFGETPNVIVAICNTPIGHPDDVRPRILPDASNNLDHESEVAIDLLVSVPRRKFGYKIGALNSTDESRVASALLLLLGFAQ